MRELIPTDVWGEVKNKKKAPHPEGCETVVVTK